MKQYKKRYAFFVLKRWLIVIVCLISASALCIVNVKPIVFVYAKSTAETILINAANQAVLNVLEQDGITYTDISNISRKNDNTIAGIEINIEKVNLLKSKISNEIARIVSANNKYDLYMHTGTLFGNEYTTGYGPKIKFKMQLTETAMIDFESRFEDAGINNVLHQIIIKIDIWASVLMMGCTDGFSVSTTALAAQTVIAGEVPDSFTNVVETAGSDIADEIFNYADLD